MNSRGAPLGRLYRGTSLGCILLFQCMYYVELKKIKFLSIVVVLFFAFSFLSLNVRAEEELVLLPDDEQTVSSDFSEDDTENRMIVKRKSKIKREPSLHDSVFTPGNDSSTFNALLMRVSLIIFALVGFLVFIKLFMSRDQFGKPGSLLDELAQKFTGSFSGSSQGLKLKQTLILTPGQNLYLIEIDGKRLLVGGTQQGGVQFLTDLTQNMLRNEKLDFKQIEEYKLPSKALTETAFANGFSKVSVNTATENPFMGEPDTLENKNLPDEIKQKAAVASLHNRQTFKRRTNFRKSLFNESMNNAEELLRKV